MKILRSLFFGGRGASVAAQAGFVQIERSGGAIHLAPAATDSFVTGAAIKSSNASVLPAQASGLRFSDRTIERIEDLAMLRFAGCINTNLALAAELDAHVAVLQLHEQTKAVVLLLNRKQITEEQISAVVDHLTVRGWHMTSDGCQAWDCTPAHIMTVTQGDVTTDKLSDIRSIVTDPEQSALWHSFTDIVQWAYDNEAQDIDFVWLKESPASHIAFKINGEYVKPDRWTVPSKNLINSLGVAWQFGNGKGGKIQTNTQQQADVRVALRDGITVNLRWSGMAVDAGLVVTTRMHRMGTSAIITSLEAAGYLPWHIEVFRRNMAVLGGLITLAGVVGSGKSTILACLMAMLPDNIKKVAFEDPVEIHKLGFYEKTIMRDLLKLDDDKEFASAVASLFRSALDVFLMGEVRDSATGRVIRAIMDSGHSVFTTTHARSCLGIYDKYESPLVGIPRDVLGAPGMIKVNSYHRLMAKNCPHCALNPVDFSRTFLKSSVEQEAHLRYLAQIERLYQFDTSRLRFVNKMGCSVCQRPELPVLNGTLGRTVASELFEPDDDSCDLVLRGEKVELMRYWRSQSDGNTLSENMAGKTSMDCAMHKAALGTIDPRNAETIENFTSIENKRVRLQLRNAKGNVL
jgi:general secretion pathway protein E